MIELLIVMMQAVKNEGDDRWRKISRAVTVNAMKERKKDRKIKRKIEKWGRVVHLV